MKINSLLIKSLNTKIHVDENVVDVSQGKYQGTVSSPSPFNVYLDHVVNNDTVVEEVADKGKLLACADDLLIIMDNQGRAERGLAACDRVEIARL